MSKGQITVSLNALGTRVDASHTVEPEAFEPGIPVEDQAHAHVLSLDLFDATVSARFGLGHRLALELDVPQRQVAVDASFLGEDGERLEDFVSIHHRTETLRGLGDVRLAARYRLRVVPPDLDGWTIDGIGGISLPTGGTEPDPFALGDRGERHQHVFFGSGTVDPMLGLEAYSSRGAWNRSLWLRGRVALAENSHGYRAGGQWSGGGGVSRSRGDWGLMAQLELFHEEPSNWGGEDGVNSGRTDVLANLGVSWAASSHWSAHAFVKLPHSLEARGGQIELEPVLVLGTTRTFHFGGHAATDDHEDQEDHEGREGH